MKIEETSWTETPRHEGRENQRGERKGMKKRSETEDQVEGREDGKL